MRASRWLILTLALAALASPAGAAKRDNSIRFGYEQVIDNLDPYFNSVRGGVILAHEGWDSLIYRDPNTNEYKGQLATAWTWIDNTTLELTLREGVKFHNGQPFTADDVVYTFNLVSNPDSKISNRNMVSWIARVEKVSPFKVRLITRGPFPAAIEYLSSSRMVIYPHEYHAKVGPAGMNEKPVGTGPYKVTEHAVGKYVRLVRNADYFKGGPRAPAAVEKLEIRFIPDRQTQIAELISGGIDIIINVPPDQAEQLRTLPNLKIVTGDTMRIMFLQLDTTERTQSPPLRDIRVRKAILHAIDRPAIIKSLVGEGAQLLHSICYPSQFGCTSEGVPRYAYDPAKAKALLAEAGFANGLDIDLYAYRDRPHVEAMIGYLRAVGIKANLRFLQYAAHRDAVRAGKVPLGFQSWGSTSINDASASVSVFYKGNPDDVNQDKEVQALLQRGDVTVDEAERKKVYAQALALIQERAYALPLYSVPIYAAATKELNFTAHADEVPRFWEMSYK